MTIRESLTNLASKQNVSFKKIEGKHAMGNRSFLYSTKYSVYYKYKNSEVVVKNELDHQNLGIAVCQISLQFNKSAFEITTRSIISQIFNRKRTPLILDCRDVRLKNYMEKSDTFLKLCY